MSIKNTLLHILGVKDVYDISQKWSRLYEIGRYFAEKNNFLKEAKLQFSANQNMPGSYNDYKKALRKHRVSFKEYMYSYEYWKLNESQRDEFISRSEMQCIYRKLGDPECVKILYDKALSLATLSEFVHRKWMIVRDCTLEEFTQMVKSFDCIAKPIEGTCGSGIFMIDKDKQSNYQELYESCKKNNILLEERISACTEIQEFHPNSLNTIRVVLFSNGNKYKVFGALLRMGAHGSVIDNTHAGGVFAPINVETGVIETEAIDLNNKKYIYHPDSNKKIVGFQIPYWDKIIDTCVNASRTIPNLHFAGWDICVMEDGRIEIIEGNHAPDFDGGMQAPLKIGVKRKVQSTVKDLMGVDPLDYISVWKKHLKN